MTTSLALLEIGYDLATVLTESVIPHFFDSLIL